MKRKLTAAGMVPVYLAVCAMILLLTALGNRAVTAMAESAPIEGRRCVIIDPGHGDPDGAAAEALARELEQHPPSGGGLSRRGVLRRRRLLAHVSSTWFERRSRRAGRWVDAGRPAVHGRPVRRWPRPSRAGATVDVTRSGSHAVADEARHRAAGLGHDLADRLVEGFTFLMPYYDYFSTLWADPDPRDNL